ncbi:cytochrome b5 isoform X1 [Cephus cinctus]|uniref:Cytochrome b5 isoform X1 n=1 Tax=Cephus cinctus TaxID=211228 RepID=A0AAJ7VZQ9_CEPCN|nr:cytochrome b5 isoform X1 [Cephus cinctus]
MLDRYSLEGLRRYEICGRGKFWRISSLEAAIRKGRKNEHPGGPAEILNVAGKDATEEFEEVGHSDEARNILTRMLIGALHPDDVAAIARERRNERREFWFKVAAISAVPIAVGVVTAVILWRGK